MFKIPLEELMEKIKEKSGLTEEQINAKVDDKMKLLSGLISKEGAMHIVANELGIKLADKMGGKLEIKNILTGMRDVETLGKVLQINNVSTFQRKDGAEGKVGSMLIGDETGSIRIVLWGDQTSAMEGLKVGDVVKVLSGYVRENNGVKEVHMNDRSKLMVNPKGESVGDVPTPKVSRKKISDLSEKDIDVELLGTIVQIFDLRFFEVCSKCGSRARQREDKFVCDKHDIVSPAYSYVLNLVLDDGTETIRTVLFREMIEKLLQTQKEGVLIFRDNPSSFEEVKNRLLGEQIKLKGRVNKNDMFGRLEFVVRDVDPKPDPSEEIDIMNKDAV